MRSGTPMLAPIPDAKKKGRPTPIHSILRYMGMKNKTVPLLVTALSKYESSRLIELFAGSAVLILNSNYPKNIANDNNPHLINFYNALKKGRIKFINECKLLFNKENHTEQAYKKLRDEFRTLSLKIGNEYTISGELSPEENRLAVIFFYLSHHCRRGIKYSGINLCSPFNSDLKKPPRFPEEEMFHFLKRATAIEFRNQDYMEIIGEAKRGDVVYADPPYVGAPGKRDEQLYFKLFTQEQQIELRNAAINLAIKGIPVILSNRDTPEVREWYGHARITPIKMTGTPMREVLAVFDEDSVARLVYAFPLRISDSKQDGTDQHEEKTERVDETVSAFSFSTAAVLSAAGAASAVSTRALPAFADATVMALFASKFSPCVFPLAVFPSGSGGISSRVMPCYPFPEDGDIASISAEHETSALSIKGKRKQSFTLLPFKKGKKEIPSRKNSSNLMLFPASDSPVISAAQGAGGMMTAALLATGTFPKRKEGAEPSRLGLLELTHMPTTSTDPSSTDGAVSTLSTASVVSTTPTLFRAKPRQVSYHTPRINRRRIN